MIEGSTWTDLVTKGFVVIPSFLSDDEKAFLVDDYQNAPMSPNVSYPMKMVRKHVLERMHDKLTAVSAEIAASAGITADELEGAGYFATQYGIFPWHQDVDSYLPFQDHLNYLNFYIPIIKPDPEKSNVCILPFDKLKEASPAAYELVRGNGGLMCTRKAGKTEMTDMNVDGNKPLFDFDIEKLAVTPHLRAGDMLLFRGDCLHRTQDSHTQRVSASFRMYNSKKIVSRAALVSGGVEKYVFLMKNRHFYRCVIDCFEAAGKSEVPAGQIVAHVAKNLPELREKPLSVPDFLHAFTKPF